ncbi:roadblock/LC7 domain-containing protein [Nocardia barduliensis]|uniref:roadblock/LC7 domain-containing protein n=1 Tax=Nocardia barduliensis TaxID=2736643 RepID=UPI0028AAE83D|nr:roadblock/LC7 domain-containing protein [Nocardia barduliensis]
MTSSASTDLDWLRRELDQRLPGVRSATLLSADGLLIARCRSLPRPEAEHLCAMSAALYSLPRGAGIRFAGRGVRQVVLELDDAVFFVTAGGPNACLSL